MNDIKKEILSYTKVLKNLRAIYIKIHNDHINEKSKHPYANHDFSLGVREGMRMAILDTIKNIKYLKKLA